MQTHGRLKPDVLRTALWALCVAIATTLALGYGTITAWAAEDGMIDDEGLPLVAESVVFDDIYALTAEENSAPMYNGLLVDCTEDYTYAFEVVRLVNAERAKENLAPLTMDQDLLNAAMKRAPEVSVLFSHTRPDGSSCFTACDKASGENIAMGQATPAAVMNSWMNSSGHRANIMDPSYTTIGVGCVNYGSGTFGYWVQMFGCGTAVEASQPANKAVTEKVAVPLSWMTPTNFQFRSTRYDVEVGKTEQVETRFINTGSEGFVVELAPSNFTYSVDNTAVATVSSNGVITGKSAGSTTLWASVPGTSVNFSVPVTVTDTDAAGMGTWKKSSGKWWYSFNDGSYATGWLRISGTWYYFDRAGWMKTGWQKIGGTWYYLKNSGAMATGWCKVAGKWYYLKSSGAMATGWQKLDGTWYYLKSSGAMATGWYKVGGKWYYSNGSGAMQANKWIGNYYVTGSGAMATNQWIGKYHVNGSGKWDKSR